MILLPVWPGMHLFQTSPWYDGGGSVAGYAFVYALAEYAYFHVYGGKEEEFPNAPKPPKRLVL